MCHFKQVKGGQVKGQGHAGSTNCPWTTFQFENIAQSSGDMNFWKGQITVVLLKKVLTLFKTSHCLYTSAVHVF